MSLFPKEDTVPATARELQQIVDLQDLSDNERLTALREAYARIVHDMNPQLEAVDTLVERRRAGLNRDKPGR